jgi:hypothetical protein
MSEDCSLHDITNCGLAIGPNKAAGLGRFVDGIHHVLVRFQGFIGFACQKECLAAFLVCSEAQGLEIPAEELDKALIYEKNGARNVILTHQSQVLIDLMNEC